MTPATGVTGLWEIAASDCQLAHGEVYHWFEVEDSSANSSPLLLIQCTDPLTFTVDWRLFPPGSTDNRQPAAVIKCENGKLVPCDLGGERVCFESEVQLDILPTNNRLVIYELPTAWVMSRGLNQPDRDVGTFRDTRALVDKTVRGANFADLELFGIVASRPFLPL
jgi:hypothetical protein